MGACDAHVHVFGSPSRFPLAADRRYTPCEAPKEKLFALHALLGIERCVIVQPSPYGFDNSVTEDALAARKGAYVGVALVPLTVSDAERASWQGPPYADAVPFARPLVEDAGDRVLWELTGRIQTSTTCPTMVCL